MIDTFTEKSDLPPVSPSWLFLDDTQAIRARPRRIMRHGPAQFRSELNDVLSGASQAWMMRCGWIASRSVGDALIGFFDLRHRACAEPFFDQLSDAFQEFVNEDPAGSTWVVCGVDRRTGMFAPSLGVGIYHSSQHVIDRLNRLENDIDVLLPPERDESREVAF